MKSEGGYLKLGFDGFKWRRLSRKGYNVYRSLETELEYTEHAVRRLNQRWGGNEDLVLRALKGRNLPSPNPEYINKRAGDLLLSIDPRDGGLIVTIIPK